MNLPAPTAVAPGTQRCPSCYTETTALKAYRLPTFLIFLFFGASFRHQLIVACPSCMRRELGRLALINILPANLLWLLLLAPWYSIAALRSLTPGHSKLAAGMSAVDKAALATTGQRSGLPVTVHGVPPTYTASQVPYRQNTPQAPAMSPVPEGRARLSERAVTYWAWAFGAWAVMALVGLGYMATFRSESAAVDAALMASFPTGFFLGAWRGAIRVRREGRPAGMVLAAGVLGGVLLGALVVFFFEGIFPAL